MIQVQDKPLDDPIKETCDECNGTGHIDHDKYPKYKWVKQLCPKCKGFGKLDWIEKITGRKIDGIWDPKFAGVLITEEQEKK